MDLGVEALLNGAQADLMYSDPPWGDGNLKYWATMNRKMTGAEVQQPNLDAFLTRLFDLARRFVKNTVLIEYGTAWKDYLIRMARDHGFTHVGFGTVYYGRPPRPLYLHLFQKTPSGEIGPEFSRRVTGTSGYMTVSHAVEMFRVPDGILLDPCCGFGYSARAAVDYGMRFFGNELNEKRLGKTIDFLRARTRT
jgi:hypothetical protein